MRVIIVNRSLRFPKLSCVQFRANFVSYYLVRYPNPALSD